MPKSVVTGGSWSFAPSASSSPVFNTNYISTQMTEEGYFIDTLSQAIGKAISDNKLSRNRNEIKERLPIYFFYPTQYLSLMTSFTSIPFNGR